jgi:UMF1 family MFS transporter
MTDAGVEPQGKVASARPKGVGGVWSPSGFSWALFEFARNPYYMLIVTYVIPPYFANFIVGDPVLGQASVSEATKWAGLIGAFTAPVLGSMMDKGGARKPLMLVFLAMLSISAVSLWWALPGTIDADKTFHPPTAGLGMVGTMSFLVLGFVGYTYSEMMHNAMLRSAGRPESLSHISGAGIGLGQLSSAMCLVGLAVIATAAPKLGAVDSGYLLQRGTGPFVAVWMLILVIPFFLFVPDGKPEGGSWGRAAKHVFSKNGKLNPIGAIFGCFAYVAGLFKQFPQAMRYLVACVFYKDGLIALLSLGGVYTAGVLGWSLIETVLYGIWASIFGTLGAFFLAGPLDRALGARRAIMLQLALLCVGVVVALGVTKDSIFYGLIPSGQDVLGGQIFNSLSDIFYLGLIALIAAVAAANISSSRYMISVLAPKERTAEF